VTDVYGDVYGDTYGSPTIATSGTRSKIWVEVDWDKTGDFSTWGDDVSDYTRRAGGVSATYGRDQSTALAPIVSGSGSFTLANDLVDPRDKTKGRRFTPRNVNSPLYGKLKPARPVRIRREVAGAPYTLFVGHTDDTPINPDTNAHTVSVSCVDDLADMRGQNLSTQLYRGVRTGEAIGLILDACGWTGARYLDPGATVIPWWWEDGTDALTALDKVVRSEGPPALLTKAADGGIIFLDRHHRLLRPASLTPQAIWRRFDGFSYDDAWRNVINSGTASIDVRVPALEQAVWTSDATISLADGESRLVTASASDPFYDAITPEAGVDFTQIAGSVSVDLLRTSGASATIKVTAIASSATITNLQLRAQPVPVAYTVQVSVRDQDSIDDYGPVSFPTDLPWCNQYDAEAILATAVATRAQPLPIVQARFMVGNDLAKVPLLARDLSDLVTLVEPETATNGDFHIETISHTLTGAYDHEITFGLEEAPSEPANVARADWAGVGAGQGVAGGGLDDPNLVVIVDSVVAGHRIGEGVTSA
jgi:hypothetical protein